MIKSVEVEVEDAGQIHSLEPTQAISVGRELLSWESTEGNESYLLSEAAFAEDWLRPEEDDAWVHLQPAR